MKTKHNSKLITRAVFHITEAQSLMFEVLEGTDPNGLYSEFDTLLKLIDIYEKSKSKVRL